MPKRVSVGIVTSDKVAKTRRVELTRLVRHPRYGKILRRKTVCTAHDEENQSHTGDLVEIVESRPMSATKRWRLVRVVGKGRGAEGGSAELPGAEATGLPAAEAGGQNAGDNAGEGEASSGDSAGTV